ncbi:MAG: prolyl-tRNA synthetase associated domain-containing protein [Lachnospiraceae bacterium]
MLELVHGRPVDLTGRLEKEIRTYDLLDRLGIEYERVDHKPLDTMEDCIEVDKIIDAFICKNLFLTNAQKTKFYLLMMPGDKKFHTKDLSSQINSARLSFAGEEYMEKYLDITPGSVSVMGLMNDKENCVELLMDDEVLKGEYLGCHPCINTSSIRLKMSDLTDVFLKEVKHEPVIVHLERY